jgi:uncharacterized repeat protein (TIGR02543 family)
MDYGVGIKPIPQNSTKQVDNFPIVSDQTLGEAISNANITLSNNNKLSFPSEGTGVDNVTYNEKKYKGSDAYAFLGWYSTREADQVTQVTADTKYKYSSNKTIYQIYQPKSYEISFKTNQDGITISNITARYNQIVALPQLNISGKTFKGWYWKDDGKETLFNKIMPPFNIELYAKWE